MNLKDRAFRFGPAIVLLAITATFIITATSYDPQTRAMPMAVGILTTILLVLELLAQRDDRLGALLRSVFVGRSGLPGADDAGPVSVRREIGAAFWIVAFLILSILFGFYIAIPVYVFCYLTLYARKSLIRAGIAAVGIISLLYLMFQVLLHYPIFGGILFGDFM